MKFINYLQSISGVSIFPMISLIIFVTFFALLFVYLFFARKEHIDELKNIPLK